jgi:hypothetical protein
MSRPNQTEWWQLPPEHEYWTCDPQKERELHREHYKRLESGDLDYIRTYTRLE